MGSTIGGAKSNKFLIGAAEIRIGPMSRAGRLTSADSVGLLQSTSVNYTNETVDLEAGLPKTTIDTVIVKQTAAVTASAYEYTMNNLRVMLNAGTGRNMVSEFSFSTTADIDPSVATLIQNTYTGMVGTIGGVATTASTAEVSIASSVLQLKDMAGNVVAYFDGNSTAEFTVPVSGVLTTYTFKPTAISYSTDASNVVTIYLRANAVGTTTAKLNTVGTLLGGSAIASNKIPAGTTVNAIGQLDSAVGSEIYEGVLTAGLAVGTSNPVMATSIPAAQVAVGHVLATYPMGNPGNLTIMQVLSVTASGNGSNITCSVGGSGLLFTASAGDVIYRVDEIGLGANTQTQYFALDVISLDHSNGRPTGFRFWKAAVSSGLDFSYSSDNFGTTPLSFKILKPSDLDIQTSLSGMATMINGSATSQAHPYGMAF